MKEINHWKQQQKQIELKDAQDKLVFWTIIFAGVILCLI